MFLLSNQYIIFKSSSRNEFFALSKYCLKYHIRSPFLQVHFLSCHSRYFLKMGMTEKDNFFTGVQCIWLSGCFGWNADEGSLQAHLQSSSQPCVHVRTHASHKGKSQWILPPRVWEHLKCLWTKGTGTLSRG